MIARVLSPDANRWLPAAVVVAVAAAAAITMRRDRRRMTALMPALDGGSGELRVGLGPVRLVGRYQGRVAVLRHDQRSRYRSERFQVREPLEQLRLLAESIERA